MDGFRWQRHLERKELDELQHLLETLKAHFALFPLGPHFGGKLTSIMGELMVLDKLQEKFDFGLLTYLGGGKKYDIQLGRKRVEVKSCNRDNDNVRDRRSEAGFIRIKPENFDYLVCMSFNRNLKNEQFYIFTDIEARQLPDDPMRGFKVLEIPETKHPYTPMNDEVKNLVKMSLNNWEKLHMAKS